MAVSMMAVSLAAFAPSISHAKKFGSQGTMSPNGTFSITHTRTRERIFQPHPLRSDHHTYTHTSLFLMPQLFYFVIDDLAVGGGIGLTIGNNRDGSKYFDSFGFAVAPAVGYNLELSDKISLFPQLSFSYDRNSADFGHTSADLTINILAIGAYIPVLLHIDNFFLGFGPNVSHEFWATVRRSWDGGIPGSSWSEDGPKTTLLGLTSVVGGWF